MSSFWSAGRTRFEKAEELNSISETASTKKESHCLDLRA